MQYQIHSIISCVPSAIHQNVDLPFDQEIIEKVSKSSGIRSRRIATTDTTAADLCTKAAKHVLEGIDKNDIGVLVFVTQYPDYIIPSTAHTIKERLGLPISTIAIQLNEGCSGYIYGLKLCTSLMQSSTEKYGLLLAGDTTSKVVDDNDSGTRPIFGDAGSATLICSGETDIKMELGSDGSGSNDIIIENGGFKTPISKHLPSAGDLRPVLKMDGMNVFMFGISRVPNYIKGFLTNTNTDLETIDYVVLHQANKMMNERIIRKLGIEENKALYSIEEYGNTSSASIPLTITTNLKDKIDNTIKILACGFGVGLSWGTATFFLDKDCFLDAIEY